jgi:acylglycerol lipase
MKHVEDRFQNLQCQTLFYQYWLPEGKPKAALLICHGLNEHSGRYAHLAAFFTARGYTVYSMDFIGHGRSSGTRSYIKHFSQFSQDLLIYLDMIQQWQPGLPIFLAGHSMGGLIAADILIDHQDRFKGAVLSGSLVLVPDYVSDTTVLLGKILGEIVPKLGLLEIDKQYLSRDPKVVQAYKDDPLVYNGKITVRLSSEINKGIARLEREGSAISLPILLLHGSEDKLVDPECSRYLLDKVSSLQKELIIYEGYYHEVYNEPEQQKVFQDVLTWLEKRLS